MRVINILLLFASLCAEVAFSFQRGDNGALWSRSRSYVRSGHRPREGERRVCARNMDDEDDIEGPVTKGFGGGGFGGAGKVGGSKDVLKPTRRTAFREVRGQYARILAAKSLAFEKMRDLGIVTTYDLYVRASNSEVFWFVGKLNHDQSKMDAEEALKSELPLILEYAKSLRPKELSGPLAVHFELEIFTTSGNNEMNVAQNKIDLTKFEPQSVSTPASSNNDDSEITSFQQVLSGSTDVTGFEPEIYQGGEDGFRVKRNDDGTPKKAAFEINTKSPAELEAMKVSGQELDIKTITKD